LGRLLPKGKIPVEEYLPELASGGFGIGSFGFESREREESIHGRWPDARKVGIERG
jgi:hypothetical protein